MISRKCIMFSLVDLGMKKLGILQIKLQIASITTFKSIYLRGWLTFDSYFQQHVQSRRGTVPLSRALISSLDSFKDGEKKKSSKSSILPTVWLFFNQTQFSHTPQIFRLLLAHFHFSVSALVCTEHYKRQRSPPQWTLNIVPATWYWQEESLLSICTQMIIIQCK